MRIIVHREIPADQQLRDQWNALVRQMELPQVFYTWEWAMAVAAGLRLVAEAIALTSLRRRLLGGSGCAGHRDRQCAEKDAVFLAGNTADYCDFICDPRRNPEVVEAVFAELHKLQVPMLRLANLPADSPTSQTLKASAAMHGYHTFSRPAYQCVRIVLGSAAQRRELKKQAAGRKAYRYCLKGLEKKGAVTLDHLRQADEIQANLPRFIASSRGAFRRRGALQQSRQSGAASFS